MASSKVSVSTQLTQPNQSYGIYIYHSYFDGFWYDFHTCTLTSFEYAQNLTGRIPKQVYFGKELSHKEQMRFIKLRLAMDCDYINVEFMIATKSKETKISHRPEFEVFDFTAIGSKDFCYKLRFAGGKNKIDSREDVYQGFRLLYKLGKRYVALNDKVSKEKHSKQLHKVSEEIEYKPPTGIKYQEAMASFANHSQAKTPTQAIHLQITPPSQPTKPRCLEPYEIEEVWENGECIERSWVPED